MLALPGSLEDRLRTRPARPRRDRASSPDRTRSPPKGPRCAAAHLAEQASRTRPRWPRGPPDRSRPTPRKERLTPREPPGGDPHRRWPEDQRPGSCKAGTSRLALQRITRLTHQHAASCTPASWAHNRRTPIFQTPGTTVTRRTHSREVSLTSRVCTITGSGSLVSRSGCGLRPHGRDPCRLPCNCFPPPKPTAKNSPHGLGAFLRARGFWPGLLWWPVLPAQTPDRLLS